MASSGCAGVVQGCALRVGALEPNGVPDPGAGNLFTVDFVRVAYTLVVQEGTEIIVPSACGTNCVDFKADDTLRRFDIEIEVCEHNPQLFALMTGGTVLTETNVITPGGGVKDAEGYASPAIGDTLGAPNGVSVEVWAKRIQNGGLDPDFPYHRFVFTKVRSLRQAGTREFTNGAHAFVFSGQAVQNENWFDGPMNDWNVDSDKPYQDLPVTSLPATQCDAQPISVS